MQRAKTIKRGLVAAAVAVTLTLPVRFAVGEGGLEIGVADCVAQGSCRPATDWVCNLNGDDDHDDKCRVADCGVGTPPPTTTTD